MNRIPLLALLLLAALPGALFLWSRMTETHVLRLGASREGSDSHRLAVALARALERHVEDVRVEIVETGGSSDSLRRLRRGELELAAVQADANLVAEARLVATLYPDVYQLLARVDSGIAAVSDLRGKRVALPPRTSGQFASFWFVARHYGLSETDLVIVPTQSDTDANDKLLEGQVEALFRVRPPGNASVRELVDRSSVKLIPIEQAAAMRLIEPALEEGIIAKGSYRGHEPLPEEDLPTVAVPRLLLAHHAVPSYAMARVTETLFEQRKELLAECSLAGFIERPDESRGTFLPLHVGARNYYEREEPGFLQEQAEPIALMITLIAVMASFGVQMNRRRQKTRVRSYNRELMALLHEAEHLDDRERLSEIADRLNDILQEVVQRRNDDEISAEDFEFFSFVWEMARDEANERLLEGR